MTGRWVRIIGPTLMGAAFLAFTVANVLLFLDLVLFPEANLLLWRQAITLFGVALLLYGLIRSNE